MQGVRLASHVPWPKKVLGLYILLADDDEVYTHGVADPGGVDPDPILKGKTGSDR